jgi:signal transduction histidine kinase
MDKHNGLISARSHENEGASFIIILPINQTNEAIQPSNTEKIYQ